MLTSLHQNLLKNRHNYEVIKHKIYSRYVCLYYQAELSSIEISIPLDISPLLIPPCNAVPFLLLLSSLVPELRKRSAQELRICSIEYPLITWNFPLGICWAAKKPTQIPAQDWSSYPSPTILILALSIKSSFLAATTSQRPRAILSVFGVTDTYS